MKVKTHDVQDVINYGYTLEPHQFFKMLKSEGFINEVNEEQQTIYDPVIFHITIK